MIHRVGVLALLAAILVRATPQDEVFNHTKDNSIVRCGGVLTYPETNSIAHQQFQSHDLNERCAWTVVTSEIYVQKFSVEVSYLGYDVNEPDAPRLTATCFNGYGSSSLSLNYNLSHTGTLETGRCDVLIISFATGPSNPNQGRGFALTYISERLTGGSQPVPYSNHTVLNDEDGGILKYPASGNYTNYELATFMFNPVNNTFHSENRVDLVYFQDGLEEASCIDYLEVFVYEFNSVAEGDDVWELKYTICGSDKIFEQKGNDMMLVVFRSDWTNANTGFYLKYSTCSK